VALPCLKTWQSLADFKYPESSVEYQPTTINVADLSRIPPQLLKIYSWQKQKLLAMELSSLRQILNTQCGLVRYQAAKYSAFYLYHQVKIFYFSLEELCHWSSDMKLFGHQRFLLILNLMVNN